jgi:dethiobiotin synthetase
MMRGVFITGTGTGVGKTRICLLAPLADAWFAETTEQRPC